MSDCIGTGCKAESLLARIAALEAEIAALHAEIDDCHRRMIQMQPAMSESVWTGCGDCDCSFACHDGEARCIRMPLLPPREPLTSDRVFEIWERAAQIDLSGRVNELIRTKDAQCVIRAIVMAVQEQT